MNVHATLEQPSEEVFDADKYIGKLVALRDKIDALDEEHKERLRPYKEMKDRLERMILGHLLKTNAQNISAKKGTASVLHRKSASLEDPAAFMTYVISNQAWDLIDRKANAKAVEDFINEHNSAPPGVKYSDAIVLGLRRK